MIGYVALAIVLLRLFWGFAGRSHASFSSFLRSPSFVFQHVVSLFKGEQARFIGHNPLGGWMSVLLLVLVFLVCASGWLYTTDRYWGIEWVEDLHRILTNILLVSVGIHVTGVLLTSVHDKENLVKSMFTGKKRPPAGNDVL